MPEHDKRCLPRARNGGAANPRSSQSVKQSVFDGASAVATLDISTINVNHAVKVFIPSLDDDSDAPAGGKQNVDARIRLRLRLPQPEAIFLLILVLEVDPASVWCYLYFARRAGMLLADGNGC